MITDIITIADKKGLNVLYEKDNDGVRKILEEYYHKGVM
jgi:hypothetical protein